MKSLKRTLIPALLLVFTCETAFPISIGVRSSQDYYFTMKVLRQIKPMIENFKTDDLYKKYENLLKGFESATLDYYSNNFDSSVVKFYNLKLEMMKFLQELSDVYLKRTNDLLARSIKDNDAVNVFLEYNKQSGYVEYFKKPFDPLRDVKPYNEKFTARDFHFFYDSPKIEDWLHSGYYYHGQALKIYNDKEIEFLKSRKKIKSEHIDLIIEKYLDVIGYCRTAKQCALEIYKNHNDFETLSIMDKYKIRKDQITPIFDDRIPEEFKVDAVDNVKLLYYVEVERRKKALGQQ